MPGTDTSEEDDADTLDLSSRQLKRLEPASSFTDNSITTLLIDKNELSKLENLESYSHVMKLSASHNQMVRMYWISGMKQLQILNLSHNNIVCIEGLRDLINLTWLCLAGNNIKTLDHLTTNVRLEHVDVSRNNIANLADLSQLTHLKKLLLHGNKITSLKFSERYLPAGLESLTLSENRVSDLTEICHLSHLASLEELSFMENPCVISLGGKATFDYRPYIINWCLNLRILDGYMVGQKESLKAEWLYSQGKGRQFRPGEHHRLIQYLVTSCPITSAERLNSEEDEHLAKILDKAKQHQKDLTTISTNGPTALDLKDIRPVSTTSDYSVELPAALYEANNSLMTRSVDSSSGLLGDIEGIDLMTQSLDPTLLGRQMWAKPPSHNHVPQHPTDLKLQEVQIEETTASHHHVSTPQLASGSKFVPVPDTLLSPDSRPATSVSTRMNPRLAVQKTSKLSKPSTPNCDKRSTSSLVGSGGPPRRPGTASKVTRTNVQSRIATSTNTPRSARSTSQQDRPRSAGRGTEMKCSRSLQAVKSYTRPASCDSTPVTRRSSLNAPARDRQVTRLKSPTPSARLTVPDDSASDKSVGSDASSSKLKAIKSLALQKRNKNKRSPTPPHRTESPRKSAEVVHEKKRHEPPPQEDTTPEPACTPEELDAAVKIQSTWRGYHTRNNGKGKEVRGEIRTHRAEEHILNLTSELQQAKADLDKEKKLRNLQIDAIRALWQNIQKLQGPGDNDVKDADHLAQSTNKSSQQDEKIEKLAQHCASLQEQVNELKSCVFSLMSFLKFAIPQDSNHASCSDGLHCDTDDTGDSFLPRQRSQSTSQVEGHPECKKSARPTTLPISSGAATTTKPRMAANLHTLQSTGRPGKNCPESIDIFAQEFVDKLLELISPKT